MLDDAFLFAFLITVGVGLATPVDFPRRRDTITRCPILSTEPGRFSLKSELRFHEELEDPRVDKDALSPGLKVY